MAGRHIVNEERRSRRVRPLPAEPPPRNRGDVSFNNELHQDVDGYTPGGASQTAHSFPEDGQPSQSLSGISFHFDQSYTHEYDLPQSDSGPASQFDQSSTHEYDLPQSDSGQAFQFDQSCTHEYKLPESDSGPAFQSDQSSINYINPPQTEYVTTYEKPLPDYESVRNNGRAENSEGEYCDMNQAKQLRRDVRNNYEYCSNDYQRVISNEIMEKRDCFKSRPEEFIYAFESTHDEIRTDEENFIIVDLLRKGNSNSPILGGNLDQLAMLACRCSSPHVVKRALDALLNEIFLSISDSSKIPRFRNILEAEEILRASFLEFIHVDHMRAKCHRMTTYAWLITLVLLKCTKTQFIDIQPKIKEFDKTLDGLQNDREHIGRNTFRYGIYLARESIKRIVQSCGKKISSESLKRSIRKCENFLTSKLEKDEVKKLGQAISDGGSWLDLHVCLVFLQDLPKFHQFQDNRKPIFLIQMLIADYRERCGTNKVKSLLKISNYKWQFEILVYHLTLRLIRTSKNKANIEQVLTGEQGCGGVFRNWIQNRWETTKDDQLVLMHLKLCQRAVFLAKPNSFKQFIEDNSKGDEKRLIETLSILRLSSTYKDKVLEILSESRLTIGQQRVSTFDALMSGKKCLLKLHQHSKEEVLRAEALKTVPLRQEIEILQVLSAERCQNLVGLLGSSIEAPMHMIIERTPKGDLLTYLQDLSNPPEAEELLQIALDICKAMIYLGRQNIIHRDLCAKNCFVSFMHEGNLLTKLGDFHLAVHSYSGPRSPASLNLRRNNSVKSLVNEDFPKQFAVRWMAVETLRLGEFSPASDVWSFGVLLFEIFTLGRKPYANMPSGLSLDRDEDVRKFVLNGKRLEHHPKIPESIRELIQFTMIDVAHRPTFSSVKDKLMGIKFDDEIYAVPAFFDLSNANIYDTSRQQINLTRTGCSASGSFCECQNASDIAAPLNDDDTPGHFIKEFIPASSYPDILKLIELEFPSVAVITDRIVHIEKVELITEVGDFGSLEEFINLLGCPIESAIRYLSQIGEAVSFLHNRGFIHRNLRAASVFMYSNGNAKLACFARVAKLKTETMPINFPMFDDSLRRSSPEVIIDGKYSKASDVWAFAVLIWEMFTLIDKERDESDDEIPHLPYHHLRSKEQILSYLKEGKRLGRPKNSPDWLYKKMLKCWEYNAQDRLKCQDIMNCTNEHIYSTTTRL